MRIPRIYTQCHLAANTHVILEGTTAHYLGKVLRMTAGRELIVFNGKGGEYQATIDTLNKKTVSLNIDAFTDTNKESPLATHLAIGLSRSERWDYVLQKATELGVTQITPLFTERCEVKLSGERLLKKQAHWQGVITSACEQCQRNILPQLNAPLTLTDFLNTPHSGLNFVLHHRSDKNLQQYQKTNSCTLLVGPEGGLHEDEIALAQSKNFHHLTIGPRVLRTETAPLAALSILQMTWGDF